MTSGRGGSWDCRDMARFAGPYLDGELDGALIVDADAHLSSCELCRERLALSAAIRGSIRRGDKSGASEALKARVAGAMAAEKAREGSRRRDSISQARAARWRRWAPIASLAAGIALFLAMRRGRSPFSELANVDQQAIAPDVLEELVAEHARPLPPEQTDPTKVRALAEYVGVPVQPARFKKSGAKLLGGRVLPLHSERAAMLQYELGSGDGARRVSVFIFDPRRIHLGEGRLHQRDIGPRNVRIGQAAGYSVAFMQRGGVGYALASDLEEDKSAQLAALLDEQDE